jgi:hypothetical protein
MELCERFCHFASAAALHTLKIAALPGRFVVFRVNIGHVPQPAEVSSSMAEPILSAAGEPRARPILTMIAVGTIVPFLLLGGRPFVTVGDSRRRYRDVEPVAGALVAYAWLGEELYGPQVDGRCESARGNPARLKPPISPQTAENSILHNPGDIPHKLSKLPAL